MLRNNIGSLIKSTRKMRCDVSRQEFRFKFTRMWFRLLIQDYNYIFEENFNKYCEKTLNPPRYVQDYSTIRSGSN
jgi:hypothetical protein